MIRFPLDDVLLVIIEPANIEAMKLGRPLKIEHPTGGSAATVLIAYVPDMERFQDVLLPSMPVTIEQFDALLKEAMNWPAVLRPTKWVPS